MRAKLRKLALGLLLLSALILVLPYLIPLADTPLERVQQPFAESRMIDVLDSELHVRQWMPVGEARGRALLVHGFAGSTFSWREWVPRLRESGYEVLAVDLPAFGYSSREQREHADHELLLELIARTWPDPSRPLHLFGHSMGADVVYRVALASPAGLAGVFMVGGAPRFSGSWPAGSAALLMRLPSARRAAEVYASHRLLGEQNVATLLESAYGTAADPEAVRGYLTPLRISGTTTAIIRRMLKPRPGLDPDLQPADHLSIHLIWGSDDAWVPVERGHNALQRLPFARLHVLENSGHSPMETDIERYSDLALPLISAAEARAAASD